MRDTSDNIKEDTVELSEIVEEFNKKLYTEESSKPPETVFETIVKVGSEELLDITRNSIITKILTNH